MESWSPSQSEPLTVSYICQYQWSSLILPRAALTPPWAATVCERVGKTLESTATSRPASESCNAQRNPAPPAPTTTASNWRRGKEDLIAATVIGSRQFEQRRRSDRKSVVRSAIARIGATQYA